MYLQKKKINISHNRTTPAKVRHFSYCRKESQSRKVILIKKELGLEISFNIKAQGDFFVNKCALR